MCHCIYACHQNTNTRVDLARLDGIKQPPLLSLSLLQQTCRQFLSGGKESHSRVAGLAPSKTGGGDHICFACHTPAYHTPASRSCIPHLQRDRNVFAI